MISCQQFLVLLILSSGAAEAFGRYTVAKQHEAPLLAIDDFRDHRRWVDFEFPAILNLSKLALPRV